MIDIKVYINGYETPIAAIINVADRDLVEFEIIRLDRGFSSLNNVELFLEDYKIPCVETDDSLSLRSKSNNLFRESFGYSTVRFFVEDQSFTEIVFNVSTDREKFEEIKDMMSFLLKNNERILDICLSRTKYKSENSGDFDASFESVIDLSEKIVAQFLSVKHVLKKELRHRLELVKESANTQNYYNINPYDIIDSLDQLHQGYSPSSVLLLGKRYSLDSIRRENHIDTYNLEENKVLLGGLMSIKENLLYISGVINANMKALNYDREYEKIRPFYTPKGLFIEDMYAQLTTDGMDKRIDYLISDIDKLLYFFQKKLGVKFEGFIAPKLSHFVRKSSFYLKVYQLLDEWYALASPNIGIDKNLAKIRSTSKIYELFTLYKLIEALKNNGWEVKNSESHSFLKGFIPSEVEFYKKDSTLNVFYDRKIVGYTKETRHNDLIALNKNNNRLKYNYYNPDFVLVKNIQENVSYFILDSKYSSSYTLEQNKVLDTLYEKYFSNFAVYNAVDNTLDKQPIKCINAIHPFGKKLLTKWPSWLPKVTPNVSTIFLSKERNDLTKILSLIDETN